MQFTLDALASADPFKLELPVPPDVDQALHWQASRSPAEVMAERESITLRIEALGDQMWCQGACQEWMSGADALVAKVAETVNGPLFNKLCEAVDCPAECVESFRQGPRVLSLTCVLVAIPLLHIVIFVAGAPLYGVLPKCGIGPPVVKDASVRPIEALRANCANSNLKVFSVLKADDPLEDEIHRLTLVDATAGRMSWPRSLKKRKVSPDNFEGVSICPR